MLLGGYGSGDPVLDAPTRPPRVYFIFSLLYLFVAVVVNLGYKEL